jgi:probable rRNA maturation factor
VEVAEEQVGWAVDVVHLAGVARGVLVARGVRRGELSLSFVDDDTMAELNQRHLGGHGPTDVLAFPLDADVDDDGDRPGGGGDMPVLLGDVVVCPAEAGRNAAARSVSIDDELALLVVHGVLHILGMDHAEPDEAAVMQAAEREHLARLHASSATNEAEAR